MRPFHCSVCDQLLFFENSVCLHCGSALGFDPELGELLAIEPTDDGFMPIDNVAGRYRSCANQLSARCNWLLGGDDPQSLCESCRLTTVRPHDSDENSRTAFAEAESAKRRLLYQLRALGLPVTPRSADNENGLAFELLSARDGDVITGHESGVITLDLSESDDAHRAFVRQQLGEAYRTVLGHFRHEIGHYYWPTIVEDAGLIGEFRDLFGDETQSYEDAKQRHYSTPEEFELNSSYVSQYATMHPWEDWAETFAHYLHIQDGLDTAAAFGVRVSELSERAGRAAYVANERAAVAPMIISWLALTLGLNAMSRSIGQRELYPFVLSPGVVQKLDFVHRSIGRVAVH